MDGVIVERDNGITTEGCDLRYHESSLNTKCAPPQIDVLDWSYQVLATTGPWRGTSEKEYAIQLGVCGYREGMSITLT